MHYNDVHAILSFSHAYFPTLPTHQFQTPKKIEISGTFSYFRKGEPSRKGEPIFERGNQKVVAHYGKETLGVWVWENLKFC